MLTSAFTCSLFLCIEQMIVLEGSKRLKKYKGGLLFNALIPGESKSKSQEDGWKHRLFTFLEHDDPVKKQ